MALQFSHCALPVRDLTRQVEFFGAALGFVETDRGLLRDRTYVFLSCNPAEHHQLVMVEIPDAPITPLNHIAFRVADLDELRRHDDALRAHDATEIETVSHGTTWSIYFRDPEQNRVELFLDTPWYVTQPVRFAVDLRAPDAELMATTKARIADLPGFEPAAAWFERHGARV